MFSLPLVPLSLLTGALMAPKTGVPKGAPLPRKSMDELMAEARERAERNWGVKSKSSAAVTAWPVSSCLPGLASKSQGMPTPSTTSGAQVPGKVLMLGKAMAKTFTTRTQYRGRLLAPKVENTK